MAVEKKLSVTMNLFAKKCLPIITRNKKRLSKQLVPKSKQKLKGFFWGKSFLQLLLLKVGESILFKQSEK